MRKTVFNDLWTPTRDFTGTLGRGDHFWYLSFENCWFPETKRRLARYSLNSCFWGFLYLGHSRALEYTRMSNFVQKEFPWKYAKIPSSKLTARFGILLAKVSGISLSPFAALFSSPFSVSSSCFFFASFLHLSSLHLSSLPLFPLFHFPLFFRVVLPARIAVIGQTVWLSTRRGFLSQSGTLASTCWGLTYWQGPEQTPPGGLLGIDWAKNPWGFIG